MQLIAFAVAFACNLALTGWSSIFTLACAVNPLKSWAPKQVVAKGVFPQG